MIEIGNYRKCRIRADVDPNGEGSWSWGEIIVTCEDKNPRIDQQLFAPFSAPDSFPTKEAASENALAHAKVWIDNNL